MIEYENVTFESAMLLISKLMILRALDAFITRSKTSVNAISCICTWIEFLTYWTNLYNRMRQFVIYTYTDFPMKACARTSFIYLLNIKYLRTIDYICMYMYIFVK